jgi:ABC-2 type transport system ATP-binding protein
MHQMVERDSTVTGNSAFVSLQNVTKSYNGFVALDNVSLDIREGEIFGYIGPNGAGKTTTMKIIVGLISDFQGQAIIGGYQAPKQKDEIHKLLGYLPQNVAFQDWRTINHALKTFGKLSGLSETQVESRIPELLDLIGLTEFRHKKISQLSGGMTQKVGLAQALIHDPKLLVLDEPLGGLDPLSRHQFKETVQKLAKNGTTVLFSSHILSDVQDVADQIGILNRGKIKQVGTLEELKKRFSTQKNVAVILANNNAPWQELRAVAGVKTVEEVSSGKILLTFQPESEEEKNINETVKAIVKLNIHIRSIFPVVPSLDEIYLKYLQEDENQ